MTTRPGGLYNERGSTKPIDAPQTLIGRVLDGRFRLDSVLSEGGMGIIFLAEQLSIARTVAIKILRPTLSDEHALARRFSQEVDVVAALSHPNIVSLIDAGTDAGGLTYLVMEYVDGRTFREVLQAGTLRLPEMLEVLIQLCGALIEAHALEIVHRDLKFDNIMLTRKRDKRLHVKVLDFGVAKLLSRDMDLTRGGQVPGTPGIIAPELVAHHAPSPQSDLYSVGVLLFTMLTGEAPFQGDNDLALMHAHQFEDVPRIDQRVQPYVPEALIDLTYELMEKTPERRPENAATVRSRLEMIRRELIASYADLPPYIPPVFEENQDIFGSGAFRVVDPASRRNLIEVPFEDGEVDTTPDATRTEDEDRLIVVPTSVVTVLALLLMVLLVVLMVVIRQTF